MKNIDEIMEMLNINNPYEVQKKGVELGSKVKNLDIFFQTYGKSTWENCARILYNKTDEDLKPYLFKLMEWLQDLNWPGALLIQERLTLYKHDKWFRYVLKESIKQSKKLKSKMWTQCLFTIKHEYKEKVLKNTRKNEYGVELHMCDISQYIVREYRKLFFKYKEENVVREKLYKICKEFLFEEYYKSIFFMVLADLDIWYGRLTKEIKELAFKSIEVNLSYWRDFDNYEERKKELDKLKKRLKEYN